MATAKQRRAAAKARRAKARKKAKRKAAARKASRKRSRSKPKKKSSKRRKSSTKKTKTSKRRKKSSNDMVGKIPFLSNPTVRKAATGVGTASIAVALLSFIAPQFAGNPLIRTAIAFLTGGPIAAVAQLILGGGLGSLGGGSGGGGGMA